MGRVLVLGHRGSRRPGPENSLEAVREALAAGAAGVEVDVRRSRDGQMVCAHDPVLARGEADRLVLVENDAAILRARGIPDIAEVLDAGSSGRVVLEVKNQRRQVDYDGRRGTSARLLVSLLERRKAAGSTDDVVVSSFDKTAIRVAHRAGLPTALLTLPSIPVSAGLRVVAGGGHDELHAHTSALPARMPRRVAAAVARAHDQNVRLVIWTVTSTEDAVRFREAGVDAVICDDPAAMVRALAARPAG
jgi:glycerophosphoryl diester phosphodiesterase